MTASQRSRDWRAGASAEARARTEGRSREGLELRDYVDAHAKAGHNRPTIVAAVAIVFTRSWRLRDRIRLAWAIVR
jgi:hypothetical protein